MINRDQFRSTRLWFLNVSLRKSEDKDLCTESKDVETPLIEDLDFDDSMIMDMMLREEAQLGNVFTHLKSKRNLLEVDENDYGYMGN